MGVIYASDVLVLTLYCCTCLTFVVRTRSRTWPTLLCCVLVPRHVARVQSRRSSFSHITRIHPNWVHIRVSLFRCSSRSFLDWPASLAGSLSFAFLRYRDSKTGPGLACPSWPLTYPPYVPEPSFPLWGMRFTPASVLSIRGEAPEICVGRRKKLIEGPEIWYCVYSPCVLCMPAPHPP
jgi:hypothetical protein